LGWLGSATPSPDLFAARSCHIATLNLPYVHNELVRPRIMTRQQPERIKSFFRAYIASVKVSNEDPETSKRALARFLATKDAAVIEEAYQTFRGIFPKVPYVTEDNPPGRPKYCRSSQSCDR